MRAMVIYFKDEKALNHLLKHGVVYTIRKHKRKRTGKDWLAKDRKSGKIANVIVEYVGKLEIVYLGDNKWRGGIVFPNGKKYVYDDYLDEKYVQHSGFKTLNAWIRALMRLNGIRTWRKMTIDWHLYKVTLVKKLEERDRRGS
ncbi:hypothetical protein [Thermococcus barophilus]|uniref:hypothetical protein n=1 Tax=Thermococcus barophilus TaxID=55802 RepID=UPI0011AE2173|nr:hypothetical protein [Thermococcus barophilus]